MTTRSTHLVYLWSEGMVSNSSSVNEAFCTKLMININRTKDILFQPNITAAILVYNDTGEAKAWIDGAVRDYPDQDSAIAAVRLRQ